MASVACSEKLPPIDLGSIAVGSGDQEVTSCDQNMEEGEIDEDLSMEENLPITETPKVIALDEKEEGEITSDEDDSEVVCVSTRASRGPRVSSNTVTRRTKSTSMSGIKSTVST